MISESDFLALSTQAQRNLTSVIEYITLNNMGLSALLEDLENPMNTTEEALTGEKFLSLVAALEDVNAKYGNFLTRIRGNATTLPPTETH